MAKAEHPPKLVVVAEELPPPIDLTKKPKAAVKPAAVKQVNADEDAFQAGHYHDTEQISKRERNKY